MSRVSILSPYDELAGVVSVGKVKFKIVIPKILSIKCIIANAAKRITIPINALVIVPLALSSACLSPPEEIHLIAPIINMKKKISTPATKPKVTATVMNFCRKTGPVSLLKGPKAGFVIIFG
jgi:hypothetical protein